jgi:hypothetical protein
MSGKKIKQDVIAGLMEAHRHAHELACHVGAKELCEYHAP